MIAMPLITAERVDSRIHPYTIEEGEVHSLRHGGEVDHSCLFKNPHPPKFSPEEIIKVLEHFFGKEKKKQ